VTREWLETGVAYALVEAALWSQGSLQEALIATAWIWVLAAILLRWPSLETLGLGGRGLLASLWVVAVAGLLGAALLLLGNAAGTRHGTLNPTRVLFYVTWGLTQQFLAQSFFFLRFERLLAHRGGAVGLTAVLFAVAHLPNPVLTPLTFAMALLFGFAFARHRNLYPLAVAHALLGSAASMAFPESLLHHMRVGLGYFRFTG
jgi:membrane protease YdiL (CAAX protease family)